MGRLRLHTLDALVPVIVGAVVAVTIVARADAGVLALTLGLASAAVLIGRRRAPGATLALSGCLVVALFAIDHSAGAGAVVAPAVALYSFALARRRFHVTAAAIAAVAAVAAADSIEHSEFRYQTLGHIGLVAVPVLAAEALRNRRSYVSLLLERLELAQRTQEEEARRRVEHERIRIARDLHDVVAHTLTTINVQAGVAAHLLDREPGQARSALETIADASGDALDELRAIVGVLRERDGGTAPLEPSPNVAAIRDLVEWARRDGLEVAFETRGEPPERLPDAVQVAAFRIVQESLTNVQRHAPGALARVRLSFEPDRLEVVVANPAHAATNGSGGAGVGIVGMKERATAIGGTLVAGPSPEGFRVAAGLPYRRS